MSIKLKEDETILAQCMIQGLTTLLTSDQLIIITETKEDSYPLKDILAIDVYEDTQSYNEQVRKESRRKQIAPMLFGMLYCASLGIAVAFATKTPAVAFFFLPLGIIAGWLYPKSSLSDVIKESLLTIISRDGETVQYQFANVSTNEYRVKSFADKVFGVVTKKTPMTSFLN
ncbi:hypothetical protein FC093_16965 [Ilyomonas limi]|uniref:Uncharacterized protein n=1 Tax=Ilyomonas limi TaxID=2575867 RepID=A0A4U3KVV3_9BACT|nr:hypothetical protein [Ilyomonas limi]TKK66725.1 hypothetical protein FC093_16965 [Ilyomonas limi]